MKYNNIISSIGNTPLVKIDKLNPNKNVNLLFKYEGANPGGSIKDRAAFYMIKNAEESGELTKDKIILEPTSGNTGIALAMLGAFKGYKVKLVMSEVVSVERREIMKAYGAEVILSSGENGTDSARELAQEIFSKNPDQYYMPYQFDNPNNVLAHYETTGPEIWEQTDGEITHFITGMGTSGTLMGVGKFLREKNPKIQIIGIEPVEKHKIQGLKNMTEAINPKIYKPEDLSDKISVNTEEAQDKVRKLARIEGVFAGMSSGANLAGALKLIDNLNQGTVVTIFPDRGEKYLSTGIFRVRWME